MEYKNTSIVIDQYGNTIYVGDYPFPATFGMELEKMKQEIEHMQRFLSSRNFEKEAISKNEKNLLDNLLTSLRKVCFQTRKLIRKLEI